MEASRISQLGALIFDWLAYPDGSLISGINNANEMLSQAPCGGAELRRTWSEKALGSMLVLNS